MEGMHGNASPRDARLQILYDAHCATLLRIAAHMLGSRSDAEDALHEVFARVALHVDRLHEDARGYLIATTRNVCMDELRRRQRRGTSRLPAEAAAADAETVAVDTVVAAAVWRGLSRRERRLLLDTYSGYTQEEIAARVGMSRTAVSVAVVRARERARMLAISARGTVAVPLQATGAALQRALYRLRNAAPALGRSPLAALPEVMIGGIAVAGIAGGGIGGLAGALGPRPQGDGASGPAAASLGAPWRHGMDSHLDMTAVVNGAGAALHVTPRVPPPDSVPTPPPYQTREIIQQGLLAPSSGARQEDGVYSSLTVSPDYAQDHTVYAAGQRQAPCPESSACPMVARTTDGGTTWTVLPGSGYHGGAILLPPDFPGDRTIFAVGPDGLERSDDAGASFSTAVPASVPAAIVPNSPAHDPHVLLGTNPLTVYSSASRQVTPGPALPVGLGSVDSLAYTSDGTLFVATAKPPAPGQPPNAQVLRCPPSAPCTTVLADPSVVAFTVLVSAGYAQDRTVAAFDATCCAVYASQDGGTSFRALPAFQNVIDVLVAPRPRPPAAVVVETWAGPSAPRGVNTTVFESEDGGGTVHTVTAYSPGTRPFLAAVALPDRILTALMWPDGTEQWGVRCTQDGGTTWRHSCVG